MDVKQGGWFSVGQTQGCWQKELCNAWKKRNDHLPLRNLQAMDTPPTLLGIRHNPM